MFEKKNPLDFSNYLLFLMDFYFDIAWKICTTVHIYLFLLFCFGWFCIRFTFHIVNFPPIHFFSSSFCSLLITSTTWEFVLLLNFVLMNAMRLENEILFVTVCRCNCYNFPPWIWDWIFFQKKLEEYTTYTRNTAILLKWRDN